MESNHSFQITQRVFESKIREATQGCTKQIETLAQENAGLRSQLQLATDYIEELEKRVPRA